MPISDDWDFDYANTVLQHIDGVLSYDNGSGAQAEVGDYIRGATSGAIGKVIAVTGNVTTGTLTLTSVEGLFEDNELFDVLSTLDFDNVTPGNGGFAVGDTIVDQVSGSIIVRAIEYNTDGLGGGTIYGDIFSAFTNDSQLDIVGGQSDVADADGTGTDNGSKLGTTQTDGTLEVPGTADTNDSVIIHFDAGVQPVPEQAIVEDASTGAVALVEQVYGVTATGSVRLVDYDSTGGAFTDNNTLRARDALAYNNQVAGQVFSEGNVVVGASSGATGRVVLDTGTVLVFADQSGTWSNTEDLEVNGIKIAEANGTNTVLNLATINIPNGIRTRQRPTSIGGGVGQGGIYDAADSLNIVRKLNSLYTYSQDTFDELVQMDDDEAMDAAVKGGAYSLVFGWRLQQGAERFLRQGGLVNSTGSEVWANPQTVGAQNKITSTAFLLAATQPYRQPQLYIEQDGRKVVPWWLEGQIDILLKVRTKEDTRYVAPATPTLGQLIPGGDPQVNGAYTVFNREYGVSTYDATQVNGSAGGVNTVALGTGSDNAADRNPNGTHTLAWQTGSGVSFLVGEEFETADGNGQKVGIVVAQTGGTGTTGTLEYILKSGTQFVDTDSITGIVSGKTAAVTGTIVDVVAGFGADIRFSVVDIAATPSGGTGITGTFIPGEPVTQAVTAATGFVVYADYDNDVLYIEVDTGSFSGDNDITGDTSGASWDAGTGATYPSATSFNADLNNGEGSQPYSGSVSGDITGASAETIQNVYQWAKYATRHESDDLFIEGPGTGDDGTDGQLYRKLADAFAEIKPGAPLGTYTGSMAFGQGWFLDTNFIAAADIRSFSVVDNNGVLRNPPNLQALTVSGVATGWRVAVYRSTGAGLTVILRNEFQVGTVGSGNNQAADSTILVAANVRSVSPLPADVPDNGVLRILDPNDTGNYLRFPYSGVDRTNNIFTLASGTIGAVTGGSDLTVADNVHVVFLEEEAAGSSVTNTLQYVSDIPLVFKARLKGFKPFRSTGTFGNTGFNGGVVQTPDTIVDLP